MKALLLYLCLQIAGLHAFSQTNAITNGTFDTNLSGWTNDGGWAVSSGRARNNTNGPISPQSLFQSVGNILVTSNTITITFNYQSQNCISCGSNPSSTNLDVSFAGITYLTLVVPTGTANVIANLQNGATMNTASFAQATNVFISLTIPWVGASPASGTLAFIHRPESGWDDSFLDNIFMEAASILPVKLSSLTGLVKDGVTKINWQTAAEFNTRIFAIEVSESGNSVFKKIGEVECKNIPSGASYGFETSLSGYFRLKIVDFDGRIEYSPILKILKTRISKTVVYPNPVTDNRIILSLGTGNPKNLTATLHNANGQLLKAFTINAANQALNIENVSSGLLFLRLSNGEVYKFLKN